MGLLLLHINLTDFNQMKDVHSQFHIAITINYSFTYMYIYVSLSMSGCIINIFIFQIGKSLNLQLMKES